MPRILSLPSSSSSSSASQARSIRSGYSMSLSSVSTFKSSSLSSFDGSLPSRRYDSSSYYDSSTDYGGSSSSRIGKNDKRGRHGDSSTRKRKWQRFLSRRTECILSTLVFAAVWISCYVSMREEFSQSSQIIALKEGQRYEHDFYIFDEEPQDSEGKVKGEDEIVDDLEEDIADTADEDEEPEQNDNVVKFGQSLRSTSAIYNDRQLQRLKEDVKAAIIADPENAEIAQKMYLRNQSKLNAEVVGSDKYDYTRNRSERAIALFSFGESAIQSTLLERAVLSIRRRGEFQGAIVVLTDAPEERYNGVFDDEVFVVRARNEDLRKGHFEHEAMRCKRFKTLILNYILQIPQLDHIQFIYYLDIDIVLGSDFNAFVENLDRQYHFETPHLRKTQQSNDSDNSIFNDKNETKISNLFFLRDSDEKSFEINESFMIISRRNSQHCLDRWREEMDAHPNESFDRVALKIVEESRFSKAEGQNTRNICNIVGMNRRDYIATPRTEHGLQKILDEAHSKKVLQAARSQQVSSSHITVNKYKENIFPAMIHVVDSSFARRLSDETTKEFMAELLNLSEEERMMDMFGKMEFFPSDR